jgi:hypothetical protein
MTPEGKVKAKVKRLLKEHDAYFFMPVQTGYGAPTLDFLVCVYGFFVAIETKAGKARPTQRQELTINEIRQAGGFAIVVREDTTSLESMLNLMRRSYSALVGKHEHSVSNP